MLKANAVDTLAMLLHRSSSPGIANKNMNCQETDLDRFRQREPHKQRGNQFDCH